MILSLTIAWCLLSIPVGVLLGKCMRQGLHGAALPTMETTDDAAPAGGEQRHGDADVPAQRRPRTAPTQLQDVV